MIEICLSMDDVHQFIHICSVGNRDNENVCHAFNEAIEFICCSCGNEEAARHRAREGAETAERGNKGRERTEAGKSVGDGTEKAHEHAGEEESTTDTLY
jgi:hypothetical protein